MLFKYRLLYLIVGTTWYCYWAVSDIFRWHDAFVRTVFFQLNITTSKRLTFFLISIIGGHDMLTKSLWTWVVLKHLMFDLVTLTICWIRFKFLMVKRKNTKRVAFRTTDTITDKLNLHENWRVLRGFQTKGIILIVIMIFFFKPKVFLYASSK